MIYFLFIVLMLLSAFLVMIVLLQRGRGGGLAGAFGSGGGTTSAFGTKTGDVFTWVTVVSFVLFMVLAIVLFIQVKWASKPDKNPAHISERAEQPTPWIQKVTETTARLRWRDDASNVLGYRVLLVARDEIQVDPNKEPPVKVETSASQYLTVDGKKVYYADIKNLEPGTAYYFRVASWNKSDTSFDNYDPKISPFKFTTKGVKRLPTFTAPSSTTAPGTTSRPILPETAPKPASTSVPAASAPAVPVGPPMPAIAPTSTSATTSRP